MEMSCHCGNEGCTWPQSMEKAIADSRREALTEATDWLRRRLPGSITGIYEGNVFVDDFGDEMNAARAATGEPESYLLAVIPGDDKPDLCAMCDEPLPNDDLVLREHFRPSTLSSSAPP